jgi:hypothetical protein
MGRFYFGKMSYTILLNEKELRSNSGLKKALKKLFELKASGPEEECIWRATISRAEINDGKDFEEI